MTLIDLVFLVFTIVLGVAIVVVGQRVLQKDEVEEEQQRESLQRKERGSTTDTQQQTLDAYYEATLQLDRWRRQGAVIMSEEDLEYLVTKPVIEVEELQRIVRLVHFSIEEGYATPNSPVRLVPVNVTEEILTDEKKTEQSAPIKPKTHPALTFG